MTCIAGLVHEGTVYIGADSAGVSGWDLIIRADTKLFRTGAYLIGCTISFRMCQLLRFGWGPPRYDKEDDLFEFMCTSFVESVRARFREGGFAKKENEREEGGDFLVGIAGHLYHVGADYQVGESEAGYLATGSGESIANGALYALAHAGRPNIQPEMMIMAALKATEQFCIGVRGPFRIESIPAKVTP